MSIAGIDSIYNYYMIYGTINGSMYKIVSKKVISSKNTKKIEEGKRYNIDIYPLLDRSSKFTPANYLDAKCLFLNDSTKVCIEDGCFPNLFYSNNIEGLYLKK